MIKKEHIHSEGLDTYFRNTNLTCSVVLRIKPLLAVSDVFHVHCRFHRLCIGRWEGLPDLRQVIIDLVVQLIKSRFQDTLSKFPFPLILLRRNLGIDLVQKFPGKREQVKPVVSKGYSTLCHKNQRPLPNVKAECPNEKRTETNTIPHH